jgi:hypothetical protein
MQVCPICAIDDYVSFIRTPHDGKAIYMCSREGRHADSPYLWTVDEGGNERHYPEEGLAPELDLYSDFRRCFEEEGLWLEYGVLEDRFSRINPENFEVLRGIYGSVILDGARKYSMSSYITRHVLAKLEEWGELVYREGPATGEWAYNSRISYWALVPAPPNNRTLTYQRYSSASNHQVSE